MALRAGGAKAKGSAGELEAARLLTSWGLLVSVPLNLERNLEQVRAGGSDINGVPGLEIEVKRVETPALTSWWRQVCRAADANGTTPFLMHRANRRPWRFRIRIWAAVYTHGGQGVTLPLDADLEAAQARQWFVSYLLQNKELFDA